ncbi:NAD(P)/FAD-dependent oxidoreductase [Xylanimonas allomyrinae]|uniref:Pyridine nucleotide-disulfide oxidoreductase domain-containing protein 2 n=1 Tax=Xylanimonas allomyrinae TaxID=2509459 RepID=A0A4P6EMP6_9MICO|nr:NAD(P)/FAD-dependent oxidoreductase [Xylanimonas allomyrinae]QAY64150.1 NAD(P)/FAD-dependent oxidoreductase [Xylanimonas allomyrinae]
MSIVVVGSGINGLVAAAELARAGRTVTLLERAPRLGGFIASQERTLPGFVHDVYSSWHPLFVSGGAYALLGADLEARGARYRNTDGALTASTADVGGERRTVVGYRDPGRTAAGFSRARDRETYLAMLDAFGARAGTVFGALGGELGSGRTLGALGWRALRALGRRGVASLARDAMSSGRAFLRREFDGWEADALWAPWLLHAGLGPQHATGGVMVPVFAATLHQFGLPVVDGGAGRFVAAFESLLRDAGVDIRTGVEAEGIELRHGRACAVRTSAGVVDAGTVIASVSPQALYGTLLAESGAVARQRADAARHRPGRGAAQIHLALDRPVPWEDPALREVPLIHLSDGSGSTGVAVAQADAGLLPQVPTIVVGQQTLLDPQRAPEGKATLWLQLQEVPFAPVGDAAGLIDTRGGWAEATLRDRFLDRVLDRLEAFAPGVRATVLAADLITPADLHAANPNAVGGDPYGGDAELDQNLLWRPFPGAARHRTVVPGVWHIGAATHPGAGLAGGSGHLVAQQLLGRRSR